VGLASDLLGATMGDFLKHETLVVAPGVLVAILTLVHVWL